MRYILSLGTPPLTRILLIESGSRALIERLLPHLREGWARDVPIDLVTCYAGLPAGFESAGTVYRVSDYGSAEGRRKLVRQLRAQNYAIAGMICSGEPIMTKWKWLIALRIPAKVFIVNENGDYFWANREHAGTIRSFCMVRLGLSGADGLRTMGRLLIFPFSLLFLVVYAFKAHAGRILRQALHPNKT